MFFVFLSVPKKSTYPTIYLCNNIRKFFFSTTFAIIIITKTRNEAHIFLLFYVIIPCISIVIIFHSNLKGVDNQEKLVYQVIESAGNKGIWTRDIRFKCNLMMTEVNRILKTLESKKLIKAVKSVAVSCKLLKDTYEKLLSV